MVRNNCPDVEVRNKKVGWMLWLDFGVIVQQQNMITPHMKTNSKAIIFQPITIRCEGMPVCIYVCEWNECGAVCMVIEKRETGKRDN